MQKQLQKTVIFIGLHHIAFTTHLNVLHAFIHQTLPKKKEEGQRDALMNCLTVTFFGKASNSVGCECQQGETFHQGLLQLPLGRFCQLLHKHH